MIKVYEALQHVHEERNRVAKVRNDPSREIPTPSRNLTQGLPPRRMQREMARLHQSITRLLPQSPKPIIQFIGARQGEGTSTVVWEYGCLIAEKKNQSVLIVDGGTKNMVHHQTLEIQRTVSLHELLYDEQSLNGSFSKVKDLSLFFCGLRSEDTINPQVDVLGKNREKWMNILAQFDCVLIDSPPLSFSDDALSFCPIVDGVILVVEAESTRSPIAHHLRERILQHGGHILGFVFNRQRYYIPEWIYKNF